MYKVMIVDDADVLRRDLKRLKLWGEASGFTIEAEAADGLEALNKLESSHFDLVITDIRMPNMDGIELLRSISEKKLCPVTVMLSDFTQYHYARQGFLYGAFDYIGKPVDEAELAELLDRIHRYLDEIQEEERIRKELQELAEDTQIILEEIKQVVAQIRSRSGNAAVLASDLVDMICKRYSSDHSKTYSIIKNALQQIAGETHQTYQWLDLYLDLDGLTAAKCRDPEEMKESAKDSLEKLIGMIDKLMGSHSSEIVSRACEYVLTHVNEEISVKLLSEKLFINKSYLSEIFKQKFGMTLLQYINMAKMERAKKLLEEGKLKNYQIAELLGFSDCEYFGRLFKKYSGTLPKDYRN